MNTIVPFPDLRSGFFIIVPNESGLKYCLNAVLVLILVQYYIHYRRVGQLLWIVRPAQQSPYGRRAATPRQRPRTQLLLGTDRDRDFV